MAKFKTGDFVRILPGHDMEDFDVQDGDVGTVAESNSTCPFVVLMRTGEKVAFLEDFLEPSNPSPIRIVTRREIVPGVYGCVEIDEVGKTYVNIDCTSLFYANDLREAAHLFNQIAEALEENAKAAA